MASRTLTFLAPIDPWADPGAALDEPATTMLITPLDATDGPDTIIGTTGNDTLDGGGGADRLKGKGGDDTYLVDDEFDVIVEAPWKGHDLVISRAEAYTLPTEVEALQLQGPARRGIGNALDNTLTGSGGDNKLRGLEGDDLLIGMGGDDTLQGGSGRDTLDGGGGTNILEGGDGDDVYRISNLTTTIQEFGGRRDQVEASVDGYVLPVFVEVLALMGQAITGYGNAQANTLVGNDRDNHLFGREGGDHISGGAGHDRLDGEADDDRLFGDAGRDTLDGGLGRDFLDGGAGADLLMGGSGSDRYQVDSTGDVVVEAINQGWDTVSTAIDFRMPDNVEELVLLDGARRGYGGDADDVLRGNDGENRLEGGAGDDRIYAERLDDIVLGDDGDDTIDGGGGNDVIQGGNGNDQLTGGTGGDWFYLDTVIGSDRILDFDAAFGDRLRINQSELPIGNGDAIVDGATVSTGRATFGSDAEVVVVAQAIEGGIDTVKASALIGYGRNPYDLGEQRLFIVHNDVSSALYLFTSDDGDADIEAGELALLATITNTPSLGVTDLIFGP